MDFALPFDVLVLCKTTLLPLTPSPPLVNLVRVARERAKLINDDLCTHSLRLSACLSVCRYTWHLLPPLQPDQDRLSAVTNFPARFCGSLCNFRVEEESNCGPPPPPSSEIRNSSKLLPLRRARCSPAFVRNKWQASGRMGAARTLPPLRRASTSSLTFLPPGCETRGPAKRNHTIGWTSQSRVNGERSSTLRCLRISLSLSLLSSQSFLLFPTATSSSRFRRFLIFASRRVASPSSTSDILGRNGSTQTDRTSMVQPRVR